MKYFEYNVVEVQDCWGASELQCEIERNAIPGYELASVVQSGDNSSSYLLVYKREIY